MSMNTRFLEDFLEPKKEYTQIPFWFLNDKVDGDEYARQVEEMSKKGVWQTMPHPRFGMDRQEYFTQKYWEAFDKLVEKSAEIGSTIHLYDEYNWPSGSAGGNVTDNIKNCALGLGMKAIHTTGKQKIVFNEWTKGLKGWGKKEKYLIALIAPLNNDGQLLLEKAVKLPLPENEECTVSFDIPIGDWEVMVFYTIRTVHPSPLKPDSGGIIDYLSKNPTREFIEKTHVQYKKRYSKYFGNVIQSIFYDESTPMASGPFTWSDDFLDEFLALKGYDLLPCIPCLFYDIGKLTEKIRCDYWEVVAILFSQNHIGQMADWCQQNDIYLTGHTHEEIHRYKLGADPYMALRRQHIPAFDSLTGYKQYHDIKFAASIRNITGGDKLLCEALGLMGLWTASPRMIRQALNQIAILGVTHLVPHAFFQSVDNPKVECPPSFFEHNSYWRYYNKIAVITARQCYINSISDHYSDIAIFYPLQSWWGDSKGGRGYTFPWVVSNEVLELSEHSRLCFQEIIDKLMVNQMDLNVVDSKALEEATIENGKIKLAKQNYKVLILPPVNTIKIQDMIFIKSFIEKGGKVIVMGQLPTISMENGREDNQLIEINQQINGAIIYAQTPDDVVNIINNQIDLDIEIVKGDKNAIDITHRIANDKHIYMISNHTEEKNVVKIKLKAMGIVYLLNEEDGKTYHIPYTTENGYTIVELSLEAYSSPYIIISQQKQQLLTNKCTLQHYYEIKGKWAFNTQNLLLDVPVYKLSFLDYNNEDMIENWYKNNYDTSNWQTVNCLRESLLYNDPNIALFRIDIPICATKLKLPLPIKGDYAVYINDKLVETVLKTKDNTEEWMELPKNHNGVLGLSIFNMAPDFGILKPITFLCEPTLVELESWEKYGLWWYSGFCEYTKMLKIDKKENQKIFINLGDVRECAEIWVNDVLVNARIYPPYKVDITNNITKEENVIKIVVCNLISNQFAWDDWGTRGKGELLPSGLLGAVTIEIFDKEE